MSSLTDFHLVSRCSALKGHVNSEETGSHYVSIQTMTAYEVKENLIKYKARDSTTGSRNLLRLQRALEYIIAFMVKVPGITPAVRVPRRIHTQ